MNNNHNENNSHEQELTIDANPLTSKSLKAAILNVNPHLIVRACMEEIAAGIKLNVFDLPFYAAAFEILRTSISTRFDESDQKTYNKLMKTAQVYTYTQTQTERPSTEEDSPDE